MNDLGGKKFTLSDIKVGFADGEQESNAEHFMDMFYTKNGYYSQLLKPNIFIISGRKGCGKTILAKYFEKVNSEKFIVKYEKINSLILEEYIEFSGMPIESEERYLFQRFYLYKKIASFILDNKVTLFTLLRNKTTRPFPIRKYFSYIIKYRKLKKSFSERYSNGNYKIEGVTTTETIGSATDFTISANMTPLAIKSGESSTLKREEIAKVKRYYEYYEELKKLVLDLVDFQKIVYFIDDLDEINIKDFKERTIFLINIIRNTKDVNQELCERNEGSKCVLLIRADLLKSFNMYNSNLQKIIWDTSVELNWLRKNGSFNELIKMILNKIKNSNPDFKNFSIGEIEKIFFPKNRGKREKHIFFKKILDKGFGRPRDIVVFLDTIVKNNPEANRFEFEMIRNSEKDYSENFLGELKNELSVHYDPDFISDSFKLIKEFGRKNFHIDELKEFYENNTGLFPNLNDVYDTITILFEFSAVGNVETVYNTENSSTYFKYKFKYRDVYNATINFNKRISIHSGLVKVLNLSNQDPNQSRPL